MNEAPIIVVSYGGGTNSTALLIEMVKRGMPAPHLISMGDTGGEWPHTYEYRSMFSDWLVDNGYPPIELLRRSRRDGKWESLEANCLRGKMLPSIAYGHRTCSQKYKIEPQDKRCNNDPVLKAEWRAGRKVQKLIGYDYGEFYRAVYSEDRKYEFRYPLIEWHMNRADCVATIESVGLPQPGKSSCFFCPHMKRGEVRVLRDRHPELLARALAIEGNTRLTKIVGLGRNWSWAEFMKQGDLPFNEGANDPSSVNCGCFEAADDLPPDIRVNSEAVP